MANNRRRQRLLTQLVRMREIEHRQASAEAAQAAQSAHRSETLSARAQSLANNGASATSASHAQDLQRQLISGHRLREIAADVKRQAEHAQEHARLKLTAERKAKRRCERVEEARDNLIDERNQQFEQKFSGFSHTRRPVGTDRE